MTLIVMNFNLIKRIFIIEIIIFSIIQRTYQDDVKVWNRRLYPTNSVYESLQNNNRQLSPSSSSSSSSSSLLLSKTNAVAVPLGNINHNTDGLLVSKNNEESEEIEYEDDYKYHDSHEDLKKLPDTKKPDNKTHDESNVNNQKDYDAYYYYDDESDNVTNSQASGIEYDSSSSELIPDEKIPSSSESSVVEDNNNNENKNDEIESSSDDYISIGEAIVSVVTTKSVVNNTISLPSYVSSTTEQIIRPPVELSTLNTDDTNDDDDDDNDDNTSIVNKKLSITTEDPIVVASVQTSRSISGARFLPFNLNGENPGVEKNKTDSNKDNDDDDNNNIKNITNIESTESIIDKLDRVQSELSGGFLAGGFRTGGNALQLDVLSEQRPTTKKTPTTTGKPPVISKFLSRRYNDRKNVASQIDTDISTTSLTTTIDILNDNIDDESITNTNNKTKITFRWPSSSRKTTSSPIKTSRLPATTKKPKNKDEPQDISAFLPPGYKLKLEDKTTEKTILNDLLAKSKINLTSLLPVNYKIKDSTTSTTVKSLIDNLNIPIQNLFSKANVDISAFLPPNYNKKNDKSLINTSTTTTTTTTTTTSPIQKTLQELFSKSSVDISSLLPAGFEPKQIETKKPDETIIIDDVPIKSSTTILTTPKAPGNIKLVFPTRPGGRKIVQQKATLSPNRFTTTIKTIQKGWPTRLTTEFTGWPTPSTTPISIEKLLEAARTATINHMNNSSTQITSEASTTSSTTTTTTTTVRPTTPGICSDNCEVAGTIRLIGNSTWIPELYDRNTYEWQQLANDIEKELHLVFIKSAILRKWYKNIRIDAFSPGSILVDYFIELQDLSQRINTQELRVLFHDSLRIYNAYRWNETKIKGQTRLGNYIIDQKSTDFVVIPKLNLPQQNEKYDRWIPQWAIAIIVIGVGGLLFIIVFGVSVIINRENSSKLKSPITGMYGEDAAKNIIHASHATSSNRSSHDYPKSDISTIWNDADAWREKSFESQSQKVFMESMLPDEKKYNVYDSWKSEWNGYQPSHTSSKFAGYESATNYSRHPPDYDTNF
ncbi:rho GTPase-activating protein gacF [Aphidius gifuensis]|uniref:rho GTPase-activating protein gacF n=1 Tax=Aphidius gifuensis TaxID=684658 RepID=UPI001CDBE6CB|nr:rho GTPase-activating protein gacF [Aphidius gifuensis]